ILQAEDGIRVFHVTGVQTCALPISQVVAELAVRHPELVRELVLIAPTVNARERTLWRQILRMLQDLLGEHPKVITRGFVLYAKRSEERRVGKVSITKE